MGDNFPIIVGGFYRSGTSLVRRLLDSHSHIHCGPEVKFFVDFFGDYPRDPLAHVRLFSTARSFSVPEEALLQIFGGAFIRFHEAAAAGAGKIRWADKNPENVLYLDAWKKLLPDGFVFLHVIRQPLDALASLKTAGFPKAVPADFAGKVELYLRFRQCGDEYVASHPNTTFVIRYEDLVGAPEPTLKRVFDFLGEAHEPEVLSRFYAVERGTGIEDPKVGYSRNVHACSVGRWIFDLTTDEINLARAWLAQYLE
jgi:hypothetical protein